MTKSLLASAVLLFSGFCSAAQFPTASHVIDRQDKRLVWSDEFNTGTRANPDDWGYETKFVRNEEDQYYTTSRKNSRIENGHLVIEAIKETVPNEDYNPMGSAWNQTRQYAYYTSASLTTQGKHSWVHKRVEVRAKLPRGRGTWPAIWMLGDNISTVGWPACGEIDIMEYVGYDPSRAFSTVHKSDRNHMLGNTVFGMVSDPQLEDKFNTYATEWDSNEVRFYFNDKLFFSQQRNGEDWPFDKPMYLILNFAIGGGWGGQQGIDDTVFPQQFLVDYVRVYDIEK